MPKRVVVAMSTSSLDYYPIPHNVRILRLNVIIDGESYVDGTTLKTEDFQQWMLDNPGMMVQTSPPNRLNMTKFFLNLLDEGYEEVLFVAMSSKLSQTYEKALEIVPLLQKHLRIHIFDTKAGSFAEGFMALEADNCFRRGMNMQQTLIYLNQLRSNNIMRFCVSDIAYLIKNGRLSQTSGMVANLLKIKPIIEMTPEGTPIVSEKIISTKRAMKSMSHYIGNQIEQHPHNYMLYTLYSGKALLKEFHDMLKDDIGIEYLPAYPITPVVSAHIGPHCVGFGIFINENQQSKK